MSRSSARGSTTGAEEWTVSGCLVDMSAGLAEYLWLPLNTGKLKKLSFECYLKVCIYFSDQDTLLPIIKDWILPGTTIISDYWRAYNCLEQEGYQHLRVNHSLTFKDPETGAHTNSIESSWRAAKAVMTPSGRKKAHIPGNLARYIFQKYCREMEVDTTLHFLECAGSVFNPCRND